MANGGWHGTQEEWRRIEAPLLGIDPVMEAFATQHGLVLSKNLKDWPSRHVEWGADVRCLIQLYLVNQHALTFSLWLCASEDRGNMRYWRQEKAINEMRLSEFSSALAEHLQSGRTKLLEWSEDSAQLEFATVLRS